MDFIFMLTRQDRTVDDCLTYIDVIRPLGLRHIGFKDVGVDIGTLRALVRRIQAQGAMAYMEVVSTTAEACLASARTAVDIGVDRLLGGTQVSEILDIVRGEAHPDGRSVAYFPFPGRPQGHPTALHGTPAEIAADARRFRDMGCAGVDLLAYRAQDADPLDLVRAVRQAMDGYLIVAGSVSTPERIQALARAGADAFTVGSAVFEHAFAPGHENIIAQLEAIQAACARAR